MTAARYNRTGGYVIAYVCAFVYMLVEGDDLMTTMFYIESSFMCAILSIDVLMHLYVMLFYRLSSSESSRRHNNNRNINENVVASLLSFSVQATIVIMYTMIESVSKRWLFTFQNIYISFLCAFMNLHQIVLQKNMLTLLAVTRLACVNLKCRLVRWASSFDYRNYSRT